MIRIEHLCRKYPDAVPLRDVNAEIRDGDVVALIGPSGTGKSTFLRCLNRLESPTSGKIWIDGEDITDPKCDLPRLRRKMGMVFQSFNLFGHRTVIENIMMPPVDLLGKSRQEAYDEGMRLLRAVGLSEKALSYPDELSGGQKQRIAIARTLAMDPDTILLDEPTSALDPAMVGEVESVIRDLARTGKTLLIVTHEMAFARSIASRVFYMDEGVIYEEGTPEQIFDHPRRKNTRRFVRRLRFLELNVSGRETDLHALFGEMDRYCEKHRIPGELSMRIRLIFEELVLRRLLPAMEEPVVRFTVEYSEEAQAVVSVRYGGSRVNIEQAGGDDLSLAVLRGMLPDARYDEHSQEELPHEIGFHLLPHPWNAGLPVLE